MHRADALQFQEPHRPAVGPHRSHQSAIATRKPPIRVRIGGSELLSLTRRRLRFAGGWRDTVEREI